jgi:hypothetical protein
MRQKLGGRDHTTMLDFEAWLPRHQLDFVGRLSAGRISSKKLR